MLQTSDREKYLIERIRSLSNSTNTWGFAFLFSLLFTYYKSIEPKFDLLKNAITTDQNIGYLKKKFAIKTKIIDSFHSKLFDTLKNNAIILNNVSNGTDTSNKILRQIQKNKNFDSILKKVQEYSSSKYFDTFHRQYNVSNQNYKDFEKELSKQVKAAHDSLIKVTTISFKLPALEPIDLDTRNGLIVWLILSLIFLYYLFDVRKKINAYIKQLYQIYTIQLNAKSSDYKSLDLQLQFWFAPIVFPKDGPQEKLRSLIGWKQPVKMSVISIICILFLYVLILSAVWLSWNINDKNFLPDYNFIYDLLTILLLALITIVILFWIEPARFTEDALKKHSFDPQKRKFLKTGIAALYLIFLIPVVGNKVPLVKPGPNPYIRYRKRRKVSSKLILKRGFYVNNKKDQQVIHYAFKDGKSFLQRNINEKQFKKLQPKLKLINLQKLIFKTDISKISIPHWQYVFESESLALKDEEKYYEAILVLIFALRYSIKNLSLQYQNIQSNMRIAHLLSGLLIKFKTKLRDKEETLINNNIQYLLSIHSIEPILNYVNLPQSKFYKKWNSAKEFNWKLPALVF